MVKKIKGKFNKSRERGGGERVPPRARGGLALFLSLIILICSFPVISFASSSGSLSTVSLGAVNDNDEVWVPVEKDFNIPFSFSMSSIQTIIGARFSFDLQGDFKKDEIVTFSIDTNIKSPYLYGSATCYTNSDIISGEKYTTNIDWNTQAFTVPADCKYIVVILYLDSETASGSHTLVVSSLTYSVQSESSGLLNSILEWLRNIRDKIVGLPDAIGSFITSLGDNIKALFADLKKWFDNLGDSLREWFQNVGDWFSQLGENIKQRFKEVGQWFTDIGDRISGFFSDLWQKILDFFLPPENFWQQINDDLDTELTESLGFIYEVPKLMLLLLTYVFKGLINGTGDYTFTFPAIEVMGHKLTNSIYYDWEDSISVIPSGILGIYETVVTLIWVVCTAKIVLNIAGKLGLKFGDEIEN